jgi:protein SCO1
VPPSLRILLPVSAAGVAVVLVLAVVLGGSTNSSSRHSGAQNGGFEGALFPSGLRASDFSLTDPRGRRLSLSDYRGDVVVLAFLFSSCRACVLLAQQVRGALDELRTTPGVRTLFVSTDPKSDTPASVRRLLAETSLTGRVLYLSGTPAQLQPVWRAYAIPPVSAGKAAVEAASTVLLIDRDGIERVGFGLEQLTPESLSHDIRRLAAG